MLIMITIMVMIMIILWLCYDYIMIIMIIIIMIIMMMAIHDSSNQLVEVASTVSWRLGSKTIIDELLEPVVCCRARAPWMADALRIRNKCE